VGYDQLTPAGPATALVDAGAPITTPLLAALLAESTKARQTAATALGESIGNRAVTELFPLGEQVTYLPETVVTPQDGYTINRDAGLENKLLTPKQQTLPDNLKEEIIKYKMKNEGGVNKAMAGMVMPPPPSPTRIGMRMAQEGIQTPIDYSSSDASLMGDEQMMANAFNNSMMAGNNIPNGGMMMAADGMMKEDMEVNNAIEQYRNEMYLRNGGAVVRSRDAYSPAIPMGSGMGPSNLSQSLVNTAMGPDLTQEQIDVLNMVVGEEPMVMPGNSEVVQGKFGPIHSPTPEYLMRTNRMA
jgi:hypothetical protein